MSAWQPFQPGVQPGDSGGDGPVTRQHLFCLPQVAQRHGQIRSGPVVVEPGQGGTPCAALREREILGRDLAASGISYEHRMHGPPVRGNCLDQLAAD